MYPKNLELVLEAALLSLLVLLVSRTTAMPQQQQPQTDPATPPAPQPEQPVTNTLTAIPNQALISQVLGQSPVQQQQAAASNEQPHQAQPQQPQQQDQPYNGHPLSTFNAASNLPEQLSTTTDSPYRLSTVIPLKDSNKDILDYSDAILSDLQFTVPRVAISPGAPIPNQADYTKSLINRHHDHEQMYAYLLQLSQTYPDLTRLYDIGTSVEGRKLWVLEISENPGKHEPLKPEFRYIANMHGDEIVGRELLLHLARLILESYHATDDQQGDPDRPTGHRFIRKLVKGTRIHLMPSMNPDGYARSDVGCMYETPSRKGRLNANNIDLNRNFPSKELGTRVDAGTQPEVKAVMKWSKEVPFVLSANMHGGAVVAIIPYDSSLNVSTLGKPDERKCPDHETFFELARAYSRSHLTMSDGNMCYDKCTDYHPEVFPNDGVTTGSGWYQFYGSMQDWMYTNTNDFHITLELGCNMYPPAESLIQYWDMNKAAMLNYMRQVHKGIKGIVEDAGNRKPLANVNVHVRNIDHNITTTEFGDYFRLLAPGMYQVLFEHPGYQTEEISITLRDGMAQRHNIRMKPIGLMGQPIVPGPTGEIGTGLDQTVATVDEPIRAFDGDTHPIAIATLIMSVITVLLLVFLAGAYVIQKRRFKRSQSVSVEMQPTGRSGSGTGVNLPQLKSTSATGSGGSRSALSTHMQA